MFPDKLRNLAMLILDDAEQARLRICTAESCTGGLVAALFTDIAGSSTVFERGFVTYSNRAQGRDARCPRRRAGRLWSRLRTCGADDGRRRA
jgi:nicotinamide mononucleotide (NMN) deamidase PncC